jgi:carbon-monoxide dehydrogenase small subunit
VKVAASLTVNGVAYPVEAEPGATLLHTVRDVIGLTGSKEGCDDSECGACMMLLDGKPVNACSYLALQADGREVTTVEGLNGEDELSPLQRAFLEHGGCSAASALRACSSPPRHSCARARSRPKTRCASPCREPLPLYGLRRHRQGRAQRGCEIRARRLKAPRNEARHAGVPRSPGVPHPADSPSIHAIDSLPHMQGVAAQSLYPCGI